MKNAQNPSIYEPTLSDVLEAVQSGFARVDEQFAKVDERFSEIDSHFAKVDERLARHDALLAVLREGQENLREQLNDNTRRLITTQNRIEDIADVLEIDHERRITRLEKART